MAKYKVREHFHVLHNEKVFEPGAIIELNDDEVKRVAHQVELVVAAKAAKKPNDQ